MSKIPLQHCEGVRSGRELLMVAVAARQPIVGAARRDSRASALHTYMLVVNYLNKNKKVRRICGLSHAPRACFKKRCGGVNTESSL